MPNEPSHFNIKRVRAGAVRWYGSSTTVPQKNALRRSEFVSRMAQATPVPAMHVNDLIEFLSLADITSTFTAEPVQMVQKAKRKQASTNRLGNVGTRWHFS